MFKNFDRWAKDGAWTKVLERVQTRAEALDDLGWVASIDSTIARVHQHGATLPRLTSVSVELHEDSVLNLLTTLSGAPGAG